MVLGAGIPCVWDNDYIALGLALSTEEDLGVRIWSETYKYWVGGNCPQKGGCCPSGNLWAAWGFPGSLLPSGPRLLPSIRAPDSLPPSRPQTPPFHQGSRLAPSIRAPDSPLPSVPQAPPFHQGPRLPASIRAPASLHPQNPPHHLLSRFLIYHGTANSPAASLQFSSAIHLVFLSCSAIHSNLVDSLRASNVCLTSVILTSLHILLIPTTA